MSLENFSIPELSQNPDIKSDIFSNKKNIEQWARNYVETLKAQGIEWDELNNTIKDISEISNQIIDKNTKWGRYNSSTYVKMRLRTIWEELVDGKINLWDDMPTWLINNDSFWTLNKVDNQRRDKFLVSSNIVIWEGETINSKIRWLKEVTF